jgi:hypothetical protein
MRKVLHSLLAFRYRHNIAALSPSRASVCEVLQAAGALGRGERTTVRSFFHSPCEPTASFLAAALRSRTPSPLRVALSLIPGGGRGLFAVRDLTLGDVVSLYAGVIYGVSGDEDAERGAVAESLPRDSAYVMHRGDGIVIDAAAHAAKSDISAEDWATAHFAQHGPRANCTLIPTELDFEAAVWPFSFAGGGAAPPGSSWPVSSKIPGSSLVITKDLRAGTELLLDYSFDAASDIPSWMIRALPSSKWDAHEEACARVSITPARRPRDADARFNDLLNMRNRM